MGSISADMYIWRVDEKVLSHRGFDSWMVLVQLDGDGQYAINPVAAAIWDLADGQRTVAEIAATLRSAFGDAPDTVTADVIEWANGMATQGLLQASPTPMIKE